VGTALVIDGPDHAALQLHGVIASRDEQRLAFKIGGVIGRIAVDAGDSVHAGQVLAQIEPAEADAQLAQARELDAKAGRDLERGEHLYKDEVLSLEQLQNLRTQREIAAAQLSAAQFNHGYARIQAPADGVVLYKLAQEHELVNPGQAVLVVSAGQRGYVLRAAVADRELPQLAPGLAATIRIDALPERELTGHLTLQSRASDAASGLFPVEITLDPLDLRLASGMVASARLQPHSSTTLPRIPAGALVSAHGMAGSVFVLAAGRAQHRDVDIAFVDGGNVVLRGGLRPGETVITDGAAFLDEGEAVAPAGR
jgi:RND family efflux transporter MFP subunit